MTSKGNAEAADFYIAPDGDDDNPGTKEAPFATLSRARDAVRRLAAQGLDRNVRVLLRGGVYELPEPVVFEPQDSGTQRHSITYAAYPGEALVISGGTTISGWRPGAGYVWCAPVPEAKAGNWAFRTLFVNHERAIRARVPNLDDEQPYWRLESGELSDDGKVFTVALPPGVVKSWRDMGSAEIVVLGSWEITRKRLEAVDEDSGRVTLAAPHVAGHGAIRPAAGMPCYFENAIEVLDRPREWYLDRRAGTLHYRPLDGQDLVRAQVVAPRLRQLVKIAGTPGQPVRNLHFKGLRFAHTDWPLPAHGYNGIQACFHFGAARDVSVSDEAMRVPRIDSALEWEYAQWCSLVDCEIAHIGGAALSLRQGCCDNRVAGNRVFDVGANGIMIGENLSYLYYAGQPPLDHEVPRRNVVTDNEIHHCGADYCGAVGIWIAFTDATVVSHNLVRDLPYTGISVGFIWNSEPTVCRNNVIEYNHIHDVMKMLADGGGIYTLGLQPGTVLRGNLIHDVHRCAFTYVQSPNNGIFFDEGSEGYLVEDNIIYNAPEGAVRFNQSSAESHAWRGNSFDVAPGHAEFPRERAARAGPRDAV
jgi:hypothetical protein